MEPVPLPVPLRRRRWPRILGLSLLALVLLGIGAGLFLRWYFSTEDLDSGGPLRPRQAAYDVRRYDLEIAIDPAAKSIRGANRATVLVNDLKDGPLDRFEIQLDGRLTVTRATVDGVEATFEHDEGLVSVALASPWAAGERHAVELAYGGIPKVSRNPPWNDGFVWKTTEDGRPWVGVTGQGDGGDDWWPCKDHPSDEPDEGMSIVLTAPSDLVALTNGRRVSETRNEDGTTTSRWEVTYPINNYGVSLNIAPYVAVEERYKGIDGTLDETIVFWALPEHVEKARAMWKKAPKMLEVLGRRFGEYPFLRDKYWVAEAPYLGMEHQSLVAYGADFEDNPFGFDGLLLHETAHEWWGNKVTAADWGDFWIHEGFGTYSEAVYVNDTLGVEKYLEYLQRPRRHLGNEKPLVQGRDLTAGAAYIGDIYGKGALVLHTLRYLAGDEIFFRILHRFANDERYAYRLVATADFEALVADELGRPIPWFWQRYLYSAALPRYSVDRVAGDNGREIVTVSWENPEFEMPLPVAVGGETRRLEMPGGKGAVEVATGTPIEVDPAGWVLAEGPEK
jgi:aminopeptidase N